MAKIEIEKTQRDPLLSFNQAVTVDCSDFLGTALIFLHTFRIEPSRAVYIDDRSENIEAAIEVGMQGVLFRDARTLRAELTGAGLIVH